MLNAKPEYASKDTFDVVVSVLGVTPGYWDKKWRGNPMTDTINIDYTMENKGSDEPVALSDDIIGCDDESDYKNVRFTPNEIKRVDANTGEFIYSNDSGVLLVLKREKQQNYNWMAF
jgi:hypothetical protein